MGGIMSMYGVLKYNDIFSKAAVISSGVFRNLKHYRNTVEDKFYPDTKIYISWGELQAKEIQTYHYFQKDEKHCEADWEKQNQIHMNYLWK